jgi:GT2 family glycosyltransferase
MRPAPAIIVPVHNGVEDLERCLASLERCRPAGSAVVLYDDASTDPRVGPLLADFVSRVPGSLALRAESNGGYIRACNAAAADAPSGADLLFLNSDTEVTRGSIEEIGAVLDSERADVCCPLSSNATFLSVPRYQQPNPLPPGWSAEEMADAVRTASGAQRAQEIPTPVGFCMLVRRAAWVAWGPFDTSYGIGYGEEDEFGQRVLAGGGRMVAATRAYVWHRGGASMGPSEATRERRRANGELLLKRWPGYARSVGGFARANPFRPLLERLWHALLAAPRQPLHHVVHLVPRWELRGALRDHLLDAARADRAEANHTILVPTPDRGAWVDAIDFEVEEGIRVTGLIDLPARLGRFLEASPATEVRIHRAGEWETAGILEIARRARRAVSVVR